MIYNLDLFGKKLEEIRKNLNLTQKEISESTYINVVTIRRIEKGKVIPKFDTLEVLSPVYKEDLASLLLKYRFDDYSAFYELKNRIESKLDDGKFHTLHSELKELNFLLSFTKNPYYKNLIAQLILLTEAITLYEDNNNKKALNKLIKSIRITTPTFILDKYDSYVYSSMEIRILMNITFVLNKLNHKKKYIEILEFCINAVDTDDEIYPKLCCNLAGAYTRNEDFVKAFEFSTMGIKSCQKNRNLNGLAFLYYGKGVAEYRLNKEGYMESFKNSIYLCKAIGQDTLKDTIINNCKEVFGIDL